MVDLIIIGAGISGMTASIYASRYGLKHLIIGENPGGQGNLAHMVENYPGIKSIKGPELMRRLIKQTESYGVKIRREKVVGLSKARIPHFRDDVRPSLGSKTDDDSRLTLRKTARKSGDKRKADSSGFSEHSEMGIARLNGFVVKTDRKSYRAKALVLAMGATHRHLNIPGEEKFLGKGVSYCTTCDAPFFKDKVVAMVGGGNAAVTGAIHLASFAKKVYLIHRRKEFRAEKAWVDKARKKKNIELILSSVVKEVFGEKKVQGVKIKSTRNQKPETSQLATDGLFIEIGKVPSSSLTSQLKVKLDKRDYVLVDSNMKTNVPGVFACGDLCLQKNQMVLCQFVAAAADGARAAASAYQYLTQKDPGASWGKRTK